jgi:hypothetical protein
LSSETKIALQIIFSVAFLASQKVIQNALIILLVILAVVHPGSRHAFAHTAWKDKKRIRTVTQTAS